MFCTPDTSKQNPFASFSLRKSRTILCVLALLSLATTVASAQATFTSLHAFNSIDGVEPYYEYLVQGTDGQLYGTTYLGDGTGTVFKIATSGALSVLYTFCATAGCPDGDFPIGGLVMAPNGNFYGTTSQYGLDTVGACLPGIYGCGTIFEITPSGTFTVLHTFTGPDGFSPYANMTLGTDGNLYGTTLFGGNQSACPGGCGTVFKLTPAGKFTSLYSFQGSDGENPIGKLFQASNGNFYGTTIVGGASGTGTVFEISSAGKLTTVYNFGAGTSPGGPYAGIIQGSDGNFYGTTAGGGTTSFGTVYKLVGKKLTTLYNFCSQPGCADGNYSYAGLIQATDGNFYGTTGSGVNPGGTVFEITPSGVFTTLYTFCSQANCADGSDPYGGLLQATDGNFYGTTLQGGEQNQYGTVFKLSTGLGPFVQSVTTSGKVGAAVTILGTNLTGSTAVNFGAASASFTVNSTGSAITTTVPSGATTASITVTTPSGTLKSNATFKVIPKINSFSPSSGPVGTVVTITGVSLTQTTKVTFGGVKATSFTVNSDRQVTATVPSGAKTGKIVITTPGGTAKSPTTFTVT
ncbi:MAG TPA: choice-of-anchor tandem repeat GloVer-containing protein [Candidatus Sulfotelmatobacter sp.]|nr:choice-of-anchor tandem repeat GloVer-containing protein [Candidatus Sulfotelmatobacter sp.]